MRLSYVKVKNWVCVGGGFSRKSGHIISSITTIVARGLNFHRHDLESWLDSKIPESILVIPVYQIRVCISHDS